MSFYYIDKRIVSATNNGEIACVQPPLPPQKKSGEGAGGGAVHSYRKKAENDFIGILTSEDLKKFAARIPDVVSYGFYKRSILH